MLRSAWRGATALRDDEDDDAEGAKAVADPTTNARVAAVSFIMVTRVLAGRDGLVWFGLTLNASWQ